MESRPRSELTVLRDYLGAVASVRKARTVFLFVIIVSLIAHIGAYGSARWGRSLTMRYQELQRERDMQALSVPEAETPGPTSSTMAGSQSITPAPAKITGAPPTTGPTTLPGEKVIVVKPRRPYVTGGPVAIVLHGEKYIRVILPLAGYAGLAAAAMLIMTHLIGVNICLAGRMGGVCDATSAFFWSVVLIALLFPWRNLVPGAAIDLPDAFFDVEQLRFGLRDLPHDLLSYVLHYGRFIGFPVLALLAALVSGVRFGLAYREVQRAVEPLIVMKVV